MRERPILFSGPMVRAILEGRKTQTRRVAKAFIGRDDLDGILQRFPEQKGCPYGEPGDRLWVRETFAFNVMKASGYLYRADVDPATDGWKWTPAIHMPRKACRLELEVTGVRIERLQGISEADAKAEGAVFRDFGKDRWSNQRDGWSMEPENAPTWEHCLGTARFAFANLINKINGASTWDKNPWVWVVECARVPSTGKASE